MKKRLILFITLFYLVISFTMNYKGSSIVLAEDKKDECIEINGYSDKVDKT